MKGRLSRVTDSFIAKASVSCRLSYIVVVSDYEISLIRATHDQWQTTIENTLDTIEEPNYLVLLETDVVVGVLASKEWFEWQNEPSPLLAGTSLIFHIQ